MNKNILMSSGRLIRDFLAARGTLKRRPFHRRQSLAPQASQRPDLSGNQKTPPPSLEKRSSCEGTCGPSVETLDFSFYKVLVAEDNQINQRVIQKMLEKTGVRFKIVQSGMEVLEALRDEYFDLVLMDCYMGGMDGFEAAKAIRASKERFAQIPLIAFSAGMFDSDRQASRDAGMDDFLSKPLRYESLQAKLLEWVSRIDKKLPVLDVTALDKIRVFDDQHCSLLRSLFQIYSENTQEELSKMRDLILDVDMDRVRKKAHMLKSSAAQLGALRFERICILMELEASLTIERAQLLYKTMCKEYEDSRQRFAEYCRSLSQAAGVPLKDSLSL